MKALVSKLAAFAALRRGMLLGLAIFMGYLVTVAYIHREGQEAAARGETPLLTDFTSLYAASLLVRHQEAADLYRPRAMYQASLAAAQAAYDGKLSEKQARTIGFHPWMYPPTFILLALPLAYLPYFGAWLAWLALTAVPYLLAMRSILRDGSFWPIALGAPPVFFNLMYGQTGFLSAGLIGLGLVWLQPRPWLAGVCIGLASVKPHFGLLLPLALLCGGYWKTFGAAVATVLATIAASLLLLGPDPWYGFIGTAAHNLRGFEGNAYNWSVMTTVLSGLHQMGIDMAWAWRGQYLAGALAALAVAWAWWWRPNRSSHPGLEAAVLCTATLLAVPMAYLYDLMLLVPAIGWLWADMRERGHQRMELLLLAGAAAGLIGLRELGSASGNLPGLLLVTVLFGLAVRQLHRARNPA